MPLPFQLCTFSASQRAFPALWYPTFSACLLSSVSPHLSNVCSARQHAFLALGHLSLSAWLPISVPTQSLSVLFQLCALPASQPAFPAFQSGFSALQRIPSSLRYPQLFSASSGSSAFLPVHFSEPSTFGRYATKHDIDAPRYSEKCAVRLRTLCFPNSSACFLSSSLEFTILTQHGTEDIVDASSHSHRMRS